MQLKGTHTHDVCCVLYTRKRANLVVRKQSDYLANNWQSRAAIQFVRGRQQQMTAHRMQLNEASQTRAHIALIYCDPLIKTLYRHLTMHLRSRWR